MVYGVEGAGKIESDENDSTPRSTASNISLAIFRSAVIVG